MPRGYDPYNDPYSDRIGELIRARGDIAARQSLESGDIWGRGIQNIAGQLAGGVQQYAQVRQQEQEAKKEKERLTVQEAAVNRAIETNDVKALFRILPPDKAAIIAKGLETHQPDAIKKYGDLMSVLKAGAQANRALPAGSRPTGWAAQIQSYVQNGVLTPEQGQQYGTYDPDVEARIAKWGEKEPEAKAPEVEKIEIRNPDGSITTKLVPKVAGQEFTSAAAPKEQKTPWSDPFTGPDGVSYQRNTATGEIRPTPGVGAKPPEAPKPPTVEQEKAASFYNRAQQAADNFAKIEKKASPAAGKLWTVLQPEETQLAEQAKRQFAEAHLRKESGAAIPPEEMAYIDRTYFPQPGEGKKVIAQKTEARRAVLEGLKNQAGSAYKPLSAPPSPPVSAPVTVTAPNGKVYSFPNQDQANAFKAKAGIS